jgi:hypothetical protein
MGYGGLKQKLSRLEFGAVSAGVILHLLARSRERRDSFWQVKAYST